MEKCGLARKRPIGTSNLLCLPMHQTFIQSLNALKKLHRQPVSLQPKSADDTPAMRRRVGMLSERLAGVHITDVYLHHRGSDGSHRVGQRNGRVRVGARVEDDAVYRKPDFVELVDECAFVVTLKKGDVELRKICLQLQEERIKSSVSVHLRFPLAEEVEVGSVEDVNVHFLKKKYKDNKITPFLSL